MIPFTEGELYFFDVMSSPGPIALGITTDSVELCPIGDMVAGLKAVCSNGGMSVTHDGEGVLAIVGAMAGDIDRKSRRGMPTVVFAGKIAHLVIEEIKLQLETVGITVYLDDSGALQDNEMLIGRISSFEPEPGVLVVDGLCVRGGKVYIQSIEAAQKLFGMITFACK